MNADEVQAVTPVVRRAELDKNPSDVASMFDLVARRYDLMNTVLTGGLCHVWGVSLANALKLRGGERVLDLAAGTGTSSAVLAQRGAQVVACDLSEGMIEVGRRRYPEIEFVLGDAMDLPFEDDSFDAVTIAYGLRNIPDPVRALREMWRVVRPGGRVVVSEFSTPPNSLFRRLYDAHLTWVMPAVASLVSSDDEAYDYLAESIRDWPDQEGVARMLIEAGWGRVEYRNLSGGVVALHRAVKALV